MKLLVLVIVIFLSLNFSLGGNTITEDGSSVLSTASTPVEVKALNARENNITVDGGSIILHAFDRMQRVLSTVATPIGVNASFAYTGNVQEFNVPINVNEILIDACGASGNNIYYNGGGNGGFIQTNITVTPSSKLLLFIGGSSSGWNGGGICTSPYMQSCVNGGGATDVRTGVSLNTRLMVAGGGGSAYTSQGGSGGGLIGGGLGGGSATGGSQSAGGAGSSGCANGASGVGGVGGSNTQSYSYSCCGGGGGYYGGGAGNPAGGGSSYSKGTILQSIQGDSRCIGDGALFIRVIGCVSGTQCCSPGQYTAGNSKCHSCPAGKYSSTGMVCTACPAGSSSISGSSSCAPCLAGTYRAASGATTCIYCDPGTISSSGATVCSACPAGSYSSKIGAASCDQCPAGTYSLLPGMLLSSSCVACPIGTSSISTGSTVCTPCALNTYSGFVSGVMACSSCPSGSISNLGASICYIPYTSYTNTGKRQVFTVPDGVISIRVDAFGASGAPSAGNSYSSNSYCRSNGGKGGYIAALLPVTAGQDLYVAVGGGSRNNMNYNYNYGSYGNEIGNSGYNGGGNTQGIWPGGGASDIQTISGNMSSRIIVAGGGGAASYDQTICSNSYGTVPETMNGAPGGGLVGGGAGGGSQSSGRFSCPSGTPGVFGAGASSNALYQVNSAGGGGGGGGWYGGGSGCAANGATAAVGGGGGSSYSSGTILTNLQGYSDSSGSSMDGKVSISIAACAGGYFLTPPSTRSPQVCEACPQGSYSTANSTSCLLCQPGTFGPAEGASACILNPAGTFSTALGAIVATSAPCPAGTSSAAGASICTPCSSGSFSAAFSSSCQPCTSGSAASYGQPCTLCPSGSFSLAHAETCLPCPTGTFSGPGASVCASCSS